VETLDFLQDQTAYLARFTVAPINRDVNGVHQVIHLGVSGRHRDEAEDIRTPTSPATVLDDQPFRYRARGADLHLADRFIATPFIGETDDLLNLEAAFVWGPFSMQAEYAQLWVDSFGSLQTVDPKYDGWYVDASWYLTGETRTYEAATGVFGRPKVKNPVLWGNGKGGWGAWQIAGRYDVLNLSDANGALVGFGSNTASATVACTLCGNQETWLFGINWWLNDYTRLALNVTQSKIEGSNPVNAFGTAGANQNKGAEITGVGLRAQVDW
jgi:phosphate-selective porin OprO/OprP